MTEICYLCGKTIDKKDRTDDHIPPKSFFPSRLRKKFNPSKLKTLPTHRQCNEAYKKDEEYFFHTIGMIDYKNPVLREVWYDIRKAALRPDSQHFNQMLLNQLREEARTPGGIIIPGKAAIEYNGNRVNRVVWKIIRGLFFHEFSRYLPENILHFVTYVHGEDTGLDSEPVTKIWRIVRNAKERGEYKGIFSYKFVVNPEQRNIAAWGLLFWDRHIFSAGHHDPDCECEKCRPVQMLPMNKSSVKAKE